jgi:predicted DNA-binding transcriptional regulator AlpA
VSKARVLAAAPPPDASRRFLRPREVEALYGLSQKFLAHSRGRGDGPPYCKPSGKLVLYPVAELEAWLAASRRQSTSDTGCQE